MNDLWKTAEEISDKYKNHTVIIKQCSSNKLIVEIKPKQSQP